jgi:hypothetical protein
MGHDISTPRWQQAYGLRYFFSGRWHSAKAIPDLLEPLVDWANRLGMGTFNSLFVNWFENGHHYIGMPLTFVVHLWYTFLRKTQRQ